MIYRILKLIVKLALRVFFRKIVIKNKSILQENGPLIIVVNHPNTFMDPLIIATLFKRKVGFLGNASIFVNGVVNTIFHYFNVIPVYRQKDIPEGEKPDNTESFRASNHYLSQGNALMIFPEGSSYHELKLRKIKTGAARIALSTEEQNDFHLGLKIQPIGLYYSNPSKFRSKIYVNIDEPFEVKDFINDYKVEYFLGVQKLTDKIKRAIEENVIETEDKEQEELFYNIKRIYKKQLLNQSEQIDEPNEEFRLTKELAKSIQYFKINNEIMFAEIKEKVDNYIQILDEVHLSDIQQNALYSKSKKILLTILGGIYALIGLPFYLFGAIQNFLPYKLPYWTAKKITDEIEYHAPIMLTVGIFTFPMFYYLFGNIFHGFVSTDISILLLYLVLLPVSGFYCFHYLNFLESARLFLKLNPVLKKTNEKILELQILKSELTMALNEARNTYLKRL